MSAFRLEAAADAAAFTRISALAHAIWHEHYVPIIGIQQVEYMLADGYNLATLTRDHGAGTQFTLAVNKKIDIGYASLSPDASNTTVAWLDKLYVHKSARRQGVAQALLHRACTQARSQNARQIWLRVNRDNAASIKAYRQMGFVIEQADIKHIGRGYVMDDYLMAASLDDVSRLRA